MISDLNGRVSEWMNVWMDKSDRMMNALHGGPFQA
jgi:hypothetical protein